jgi:hypothetical protein
MTPRDIIASAQAIGAELWADGAMLRWRCPGGLPEDLKAVLVAHKPALLTLLSSPPPLATEDHEAVVEAIEEARIRTWLRSIGEECPQVVGEILERARTDPKARADYLRRAEEIGTWGAAAFYEGVLGNAAMSVATLEPGQRSEAVRIGLLPQPLAESDAVVLAYRNNGVQGLMTVPADRYDGLRVLELLALNPVS